MYGMCQNARFAAQSANATRGRSSVPSTRAHARVPGERGEHGGGEEEDEERPAHARVIISAGPRSADQHVLGHVRGEELLVGEVVERPDEREQRHAEAEREEHDRSQPARSARPRRRRRTTACAKRSAATAAKTIGQHERIVPLADGQAPQRDMSQALPVPTRPKAHAAAGNEVSARRRGRPRSSAPEFLRQRASPQDSAS